MTLVIADASMLILITKIEMIELLIDTFHQIIIPEAVRIEIVEKGKIKKCMDAFVIERKIQTGQIKIQPIQKIDEKVKLMENFNIHEGESESIILYLELKADLLGTDDYRTVKTCKLLNVHYFTTLLFITRSFKNKLITKTQALLYIEKLAEIGWYSHEIIDFFRKDINHNN